MKIVNDIKASAQLPKRTVRSDSLVISIFYSSRAKAYTALLAVCPDCDDQVDVARDPHEHGYNRGKKDAGSFVLRLATLATISLFYRYAVRNAADSGHKSDVLADPLCPKGGHSAFERLTVMAPRVR